MTTPQSYQSFRSRGSVFGQPWGLGINGHRAVKRPVQVGLRGNKHVEILQGMAEGDLAIPQASGVVTGQRVRPVLP